jgi:hypothetical protein
MTWILALAVALLAPVAVHLGLRVVVLNKQRLHLAEKCRHLAAEVDRLCVPVPAPQGADVHAVMERAVQVAPELFERARDVARLRPVIACVECGEPTMITCDACTRRVCVAHREAHGCVHEGAG